MKMLLVPPNDINVPTRGVLPILAVKQRVNHISSTERFCFNGGHN